MSDDKKRGIKLTNKNPLFASKKQNTEEFNEEANNAFNKDEEYKKRAWELAVQFKKSIEDKTLKINKGPIAEDIENEIIDKLVNLASEMNNDEMQKEGVGSVALCMVLMKCMLVQRDMINELSFALKELSKK